MDTPPNADKRDIAHAVSEAITRAGLTPLDVANRTGIAKSTLYRRLAGDPFKTTELYLIAKETGTTVSALFAECEAAA